MESPCGINMEHPCGGDVELEAPADQDSARQATPDELLFRHTCKPRGDLRAARIVIPAHLADQLLTALRARSRQALASSPVVDGGIGSMSRSCAAYRSSTASEGRRGRSISARVPRRPANVRIFCRLSRRSVSPDATIRLSSSQAEFVIQRGLAEPSSLSAGAMYASRAPGARCHERCSSRRNEASADCPAAAG